MRKREAIDEMLKDDPLSASLLAAAPLVLEALDEMLTDALVSCPFCNESEFDLIGLKNHYIKGHCDVFNNTELL